MKNKILSFYIALFLGIILYPVIGSSAERVIEFEIGESGEKIYFPMSPEEIERELALEANWREREKRRLAERPRHRMVFEYGESAHLLEFETSGERMEQAGKQFVLSGERVRLSQINKKVEIVEMAEGHFTSNSCEMAFIYSVKYQPLITTRKYNPP